MTEDAGQPRTIRAAFRAGRAFLPRARTAGSVDHDHTTAAKRGGPQSSVGANVLRDPWQASNSNDRSLTAVSFHCQFRVAAQLVHSDIPMSVETTPNVSRKRHDCQRKTPAMSVRRSSARCQPSATTAGL